MMRFGVNFNLLHITNVLTPSAVPSLPSTLWYDFFSEIGVLVVPSNLEQPMIHSHSDFLSFHPEEQSLGSVGDDLFLDLRHRIMTADFGPGRTLHVSELAKARAIEEGLAASVARALHCHGYVTNMGSGRFEVKGWSDSEFVEALKRMRDSQRSTAEKYSQQISDVDRQRLAACLDFRVSSTPGPDQIEAFYIRWWMFFHCTLHTASSSK